MTRTVGIGNPELFERKPERQDYRERAPVVSRRFPRYSGFLECCVTEAVFARYSMAPLPNVANATTITITNGR